MATVCIALHDVAPETWPHCARVLQMLDTLGAGPLTLLVVPDWHRRGSIERDGAFLRAMDERLARGDELALHGYSHLDESAPPKTLRDRLSRRFMTASEGEFAALGFEEAFDRIARGVALWNRRCWPLHGFVPPAWLMSGEARRALTQFPLAYLTTRTGVARADGSAAVATSLLCYSVRSAWRRRASHAVVGAASVLPARSLLRVAIHAADAGHRDVLEHWHRIIVRVLRRREPMTKAQWVRHVMEPALPQAAPARLRMA